MRPYRRVSWLAILLCGTWTPASGLCMETEEAGLDLPDYVEADSRDRDGLKRDTLYFAGYQWVTIGILYMAPERVSGWTDQQKEGYDMSYWWDNVTHPQMDSDDFYLNYVLHPYWGAGYFVRARERGYSEREAFWYSALLSSMYEFGAEALFEEPSIQDLIVTPVLGSMLGRYFWRLRNDIRERKYELGYQTTRDKWLWALTDPLGALNRQTDKLLGRDTRIMLRPYRTLQHHDRSPAVEPPLVESELVYGLQFRLEW